MNITQALAQYGYVGQLANSVPELRKLLAKAASLNYDVARFTRELQDSAWWKNSADSVKQYQVLAATKPGELRSQRTNMVAKIRAMAAEMGVTLTEGSGGNLDKVVRSAMMFGWDEGLLRQNIANYWKFNRGQMASGSAGEIGQKLKEIYASYGIQYSEDSIAKGLKSVLMGRTNLEGYRADAVQKAKAKYAAFGKQLDEGTTIKEIADPYIQSMSNLLEMSAPSIDLYNTTIQQALSARAADGTPTAKPLWQFEQDLRKDARWDKTKNAANSAYGMLRQIGQDWGFGG